MSKRDEYRSIVEQVLNKEIKSSKEKKSNKSKKGKKTFKNSNDNFYVNYKNFPDYGGNTSGWARHYESPEERER